MSNNEIWEIKKISEEIELCYGVGLKSDYRKKGKYPVFGSNGIIGSHNKYLIKGPGIIVGRKGTIGLVHFTEKNFWPIDTTYYIKLRRDGDINFWYYLIKSLKLYEMNSHSAVPGLNRDQAYNLKVKVPSYNLQKEIARVLKNLDLNINIRNEIIINLERIGTNLFTHWFIDFEFPNEQGKPYKSSGGEFIDSELGKIPKGWKICKLIDCGKIICGKTPPKSNKNYFGGDTPFIKIPDMHNNVFILKTEDSLTENGKKFQENKTIPAKSIGVSCIATVGLVSLTSQESQTNQQINSLIPYHEPSLYYLYFKLKTLKDYFNTLGSSGSATLNINTKIFSNIKIIMSTNDVLEKFNKMVSPIFNSILLNSRENLSLYQIRDTLLPKLITGKIRVNSEDIKES